MTSAQATVEQVVRAQLAKALSMRSNHYGLDNQLIAFKG